VYKLPQTFGWRVQPYAPNVFDIETRTAATNFYIGAISKTDVAAGAVVEWAKIYARALSRYCADLLAVKLYRSSDSRGSIRATKELFELVVSAQGA
jgi:hypothetical protein